MTKGNRPELKLGSHLAPGLAAVALFVVMAAVFLGASFGQAQGFPQDANITASIGYAMFGLDFGDVPSEGFLVAFEIIDIVLVAALAGAVMLARREQAGKMVTALVTDGGRTPTGNADEGDEGGDR
jgi:NADH-quinone oxidoreductase subunit J